MIGAVPNLMPRHNGMPVDRQRAVKWLALSWRAAASNAIEEYAASIDPIAIHWSVNAPGWVAYSFNAPRSSSVRNNRKLSMLRAGLWGMPGENECLTGRCPFV